MKKKVFLVTIGLICTIFLLIHIETYADISEDRAYIEEFIEVLAREETEYVAWADAYLSLEYECSDSFYTNNINIYYLYEGDEYLGYLIYDKVRNVVWEYSKGENILEILLENNEQVYRYLYGEYLITNPVTGQYYISNGTERKEIEESRLEEYRVSTLLESSDVADEISSEVIPYSNATVVLPNVEPHVQSGMCIPAAIANLVWYWGKQPSYESLITGKNFKTVEGLINSIMLELGSNTKGTNIKPTIQKYCDKYSTGLSVSISTPPITFAAVVNEINEGRPCLLGYRIYNTEPHMTCCVGYTQSFGTNNANYVKLIDGHSTEIVSKLWENLQNGLYCVNFY